MFALAIELIARTRPAGCWPCALEQIRCIAEREREREREKRKEGEKSTRSTL